MTNKGNSHSRLLIIFYLLVFYIFSSFAWWSYLLHSKNKLAFEQQVISERLLHIKSHQLNDNDVSFFSTETYQILESKFKRQQWMIIGEGGVFIILLLAGAWQVRKTFSKEFSLAEQQNNFLLSINHELRSPLASIKLALQTLERRITFEDKYKKLISNSLDDVERLHTLVDNILFAARMENSSYLFQLHHDNLSDFIGHLCEKFKAYSASNRKFIFQIEPAIDYSFDREAMRSALFNLLENAVKYSPDDAQVLVALYTNGSDIILEVKDEGKGIPLNERQKIFQKFYRTGSEETRIAKGTGLGLFIVKRVVDAHGAKISVLSNEPKGSVFRIVFPSLK